MNEFALETQLQTETCPHCNTEFPILSGNILLENQPVGFHAAALHGCQEPLLFMTVILAEETGGNAFFFKSWPQDDTLKIQISEPEESPFFNVGFEGEKLPREIALKHRMLDIAVFIVQEITQQETVHQYLTGSAPAPADKPNA
jgi:hypothetical protein